MKSKIDLRDLVTRPPPPPSMNLVVVAVVFVVVIVAIVIILSNIYPNCQFEYFIPTWGLFICMPGWPDECNHAVSRPLVK